MSTDAFGIFFNALTFVFLLAIILGLQMQVSKLSKKIDQLLSKSQ